MPRRRVATTASVVGTLRDRNGTVVTITGCLNFVSDFRVKLEHLAADFDPAWNRDRT
jgi:hypothetical protein